MKIITSRDNPAYKGWLKLAQNPRERSKTGLMLLDGLHLLQACPEAWLANAEILISESGCQRFEHAEWLEAHPSLRLTQLPDALFAGLATVDTPSGLMAVLPQPIPAGTPATDVDTVVLDGVQDPGNLGTLLRTAAAAGFRQAVLSADCAQPWSPKALRAGQGGHFLLTIHTVADTADFLQIFTGWSGATALDARSQSLYAPALDQPLSGPVAWVFGAEGQGVRPATLAAARQTVHIPMPGAVESLNVAAAAAICLFETVRRRATTAKAHA